MASVLPSRPDLRPTLSIKRMDWRHWAFFFGVPLLVAVYAAVNNWAVLEAVGIGGSVLFYLAHAFLPWWTSCLVTRVWMEMLRRWQPPQILILLLGTLTACLLIVPYTNWLMSEFQALWTDSYEGHFLQPFGLTEFTSYAIRASIVWIIVNLLFDRFLGLPRYRYEAAQIEVDERRALATEGVSIPTFLERLPARVTADEVIALKAEQHYVRVYTAERNHLTLSRFSDAIKELDSSAGLRVHRSYWIRTANVKALRRKQKKWSLEMDTGLVVPVSGPYRALVEQAVTGRVAAM